MTVRTYDPAEHAAQDRPLSPAELRAVLSGSGCAWPIGQAGTQIVGTGRTGSYETSTALYPWRARGLYPSLGVYDQDARRDPIVAIGLWHRAMTAASYEWRILDPDGVTDEEGARVQHVRDTLASLRGGVAGLIRRIYRREQHGFALFERVWEVEESTLQWRLEDLVYVHPMTIWSWAFDGAGFMRGAFQTSELAWYASPQNLVWLPREKLAHFGRDDTGRDPEGLSALRGAHWYVTAKAEAVALIVASLHLFGEGWLDVVTSATRGSREHAEIETALQNWQTGQRRYIMHDPETAIEARYGGSVLPDVGSIAQGFNHEIRAGLDEVLQEMGISRFGARAVGSEMRQVTHRSQGGECTELASLLREEIVVPIYQRNSWDVTRAPTIVARGAGRSAEDAAQARLIGELLRDGAIPDSIRPAAERRLSELLDL